MPIECPSWRGVASFLVLCALFVSPTRLFAEEKPPPLTAAFAGVFGDRMVLQRDQPIVVRGQGAPREALTVTIAEASRTTSVDSSGHWQVVLPPMPAGGPYELTLQDDRSTVRVIRDVLIGDVWLCSGQSNMEFPVARATGQVAPRSGKVAEIRLATVQHDSRVLPQREHAVAPEWTIAGENSIREFSAVCYFYAEALQEGHPVHLGLVHASWGGSAIETWLSAEALRQAGGYDAQLDLLQAYANDERAGTERFGVIWEDWWRRAEPKVQPWMTPGSEPSGWKAAPAEMQDWNHFGDASLADHRGMVWFRKSFQLSSAQAERDAVLDLGGIDEVDVVWINGEFVGTGFGWGTPRMYTLPRGSLRAGTNTVTVNVLSTWGAGGMLGPNARVELRFADADAVLLGEGWTYLKVPAEYGQPPRAPWHPIGGLAGLYNAMIAPLQGLKFAGVLWYQGESNAGDGKRYEGLLTALIADWRQEFGDALPFVIVQLPNFGDLPIAPSESGWAEIRDAQRRVAQDDPDTGLVVTIDAGDNADLHPPNKQIVGQRAADVARGLLFGEDRIVDGLSPASVSRQSSEVLVEFDPADDTLVVVGDSRPVAFELCADEAASCTYADARIEGNRIYLSAPAAEGASRVRYCWADAPLCNLYGESGLPVGSFEMRLTP